MKKYLLIVFLVVLSACQPSPGTLDSPEIIGREGVVITVLDVPDEVYEREVFPITYELYNNGKAEISKDNPGYVSSSVDGLYLKRNNTVTQWGGEARKSGLQPFALTPRTRFVDGEISFVTAYFEVLPLSRNSAEATTNVLISACYPYYSNITQEVCIEKERATDEGGVICTRDRFRPSSPAAPIGVSDIEVRQFRTLEGDQVLINPRFRITIENYQGGVPKLAACDEERPSGDALNKVEVRAFMLTDELECSPVNVTLIRGRGTTVCKYSAARPAPVGGNYISLLSVNLDYSYVESLSTEVRIVK